MNIGILTFHYAHNYGAMLQAYALTTFLKESGHEAKIIDYRLPYIYDRHERLGVVNFYKKRYSHTNILIGILKTIKNYPKHYFRPAKWYRFEEFLDNTLSKSDRVDLPENICESSYDAIICGSDQIWNTRLTGSLIPLYFCEGIDAQKKIAYAASNGDDYVDIKHLPEFSKLFQNFDSVSIREAGLSSFLNDAGFHNTCVLDPVFLLSYKVWDNIAEIPDETNYLLTYSFDETPFFFTFAYKIARELGKKMIVFAYEKKKNLPKDVKQYIIGGPKEFVGYVKNADFVITNSFHGTAFSIIYRKQFYCVPPKYGRERIDALLGSMGLVNRIVENDCEKKQIEPLEYSEALINKQIENSMEFINNSLN